MRSETDKTRSEVQRQYKCLLYKGRGIEYTYHMLPMSEKESYTEWLNFQTIPWVLLFIIFYAWITRSQNSSILLGFLTYFEEDSNFHKTLSTKLELITWQESNSVPERGDLPLSISLAPKARTHSWLCKWQGDSTAVILLFQIYAESKCLWTYTYGTGRLTKGNMSVFWCTFCSTN